jgi:glutamyl-tRNA reductase
MSLIVVGTSYKTSSLELREKIALHGKQHAEALEHMKKISGLRGAVIISTCNRHEIYASTDDIDNGINNIMEFISKYSRQDKEYLDEYFYVYKDKDLASHLFEVVCGLDSSIMGETQILGQVKKAFLRSETFGVIDRDLSGLFQHAIKFAGRIHSETTISEGKISVGSVALDFIKSKIGNLNGKKFLIIGVGKVTGLVLKYLASEKTDVVFISNRTFEKAKSLAEQIGASAVRFDEIDTYLNEADVVITATASPHFIIKKDTLKSAVKKKIFIADLAMPRDVDPIVNEIAGIELFSLEDINDIVNSNMNRKNQEAEKIKKIIAGEIGELW